MRRGTEPARRTLAALSWLCGAAASAADAPEPATLPTVSVTGAAVRNRIDRKVYDLSQDLQRATGSAADVLNTIPSVEVDADGNVSLRGDSHVTILIDGKPSAQLTGSRAGDGLLQWSASAIEKIEVLSNPPAQYKAEGTAGVINIVTKKARPAGTSGSLQASLGNRERALLSGNGAYNSGPLNLSVGLGLRQDDRQRRVESLLRSTDPSTGQTEISHEISDQQMRRLLTSLKATLDYRLNDGQSLGVDLSARKRSGNRFFDQHDETQLAGGSVTRASDRHSDGHEWSLSSEQTLRFRQLLRSPQEILDAVWHRSSDRERERYAYLNSFSLPVAPPSQDHLYLNHDLVTNALGLDYALTLSAGQKLKLGLALDSGDYGFVNAGDSVDASTGQAVANPVLSNQFDYRQEVKALYTSWQQTLGDWETLAGLRAEQSWGRGNQLTQGSSNQNRFSGLFPSLHVERALGETQTLSLGYSRRLSRPEPEALNPFIDYQDTHNLRAGNPALQPQDTQALEAGYRVEAAKQSYGLTAYARANRNSITDVLQVLGPDVVLATKTNLPKSLATGLEFNTEGRLAPQWTYKLGGNLFHTQIDATALGANGLKSTTGLNLKASLDFHPSSQDTAQASFSRADKRLTPQGYVDAINLVNVGYRHKVDEQLSFFATVSDLFNGQRFERHVNTGTLTQTYVRAQPGRVAYIGLSWLLGVPKKGKAATFEYDQ
jgi:outer membrane receptor for ferrienterochelin and colicin